MHNEDVNYVAQAINLLLAALSQHPEHDQSDINIHLAYEHLEKAMREHIAARKKES